MNTSVKDLKCRYMYARMSSFPLFLCIPNGLYQRTLQNQALTFSSFIHAKSSRDPLNIAKEQLLYILTYQQVMPDFMNHIFTFCRREMPHLQTSFAIEDHMSMNSSGLRIDQLGRSGIQIQHCFNLIGVERITDVKLPFALRQTAAYHSFDIASGRAFWMILKANQTIKQRVQKATAGNKRRHRLTNLDSAEISFSLVLETHLLIFRWCVENWSEYINFLESKVRPSSAHTRLSPVAGLTREDALARVASPSSSFPSRQNSGWSTGSRVSRTASLLEKIGIPPSPRNPPQLPSMDSSLTAEPEQMEIAEGLEDINLDELFSFDKLQDLHHTAERLGEASLVVGQNKRIIEEIVMRFEELQKTTIFSKHLDVNEIDFVGFFRGAKTCQMELDNQLDRLRTIIASLDKVITLVSRRWFPSPHEYKLTISSTVQRNSSVQEHANWGVFCQTSQRLYCNYAETHLQHALSCHENKTRHRFNACDHHIDPFLSPRHVRCCKIRPPTVISLASMGTDGRPDFLQHWHFRFQWRWTDEQSWGLEYALGGPEVILVCVFSAYECRFGCLGLRIPKGSEVPVGIFAGRDV